MSALVWNLILAFVWVAMTANLTPGNLFAGFLLGYVVLLFSHRVVARSSYYRKFFDLVRFLLFFVWEMILANLRVAHDVVTPTLYTRPGIVAIPLEARTDDEITLLANVISLTPGTLSLDVSDDRKVLYIHAMFIDDEQKLRDEIKNGFERRLLDVLR
jgi:multicomponent Na+:H+ antiporter subunit E